MAKTDDNSKRKPRSPRKATPKYLENAALYYLQRFASSAANLRRVMMRKVERSARHHGTDRDEGAAAVDALIERFVRSGLLDDTVYAEGRVRSLMARGASVRVMRGKLLEKGLAADVIDDTLARLGADSETAELRAALGHARRRRLGPYRDRGEREDRRQRDLAALARAGFSYGVAERVIGAESPEDLEEELTGFG